MEVVDHSILRDKERGSIIRDEVSEHSTIREIEDQDANPVENGMKLVSKNGVQTPDNSVAEIIQPRRSSRIRREPDRLVYR